MSRRAGHPGYGDRVRILSSTSGREWSGEVLVWGHTGAPFVRLDHNASARWFPASWVAQVTEGPGPGECSCEYSLEADAESGVAVEQSRTDPQCDHHGEPADTALIIKKARPLP